MIKDIESHIEDKSRTYVGQDMIYVSYNSPNTMYQVSNDLDDVLLGCSNSTIRLWHFIMSCVKRNQDPVKVVSIELRYQIINNQLSRGSYYKSIKELTDKNLLLLTTTKCLYVINIDYAHKLYRPKLEL